MVDAVQIDYLRSERQTTSDQLTADVFYWLVPCARHESIKLGSSITASQHHSRDMKNIALHSTSLGQTFYGSCPGLRSPVLTANSKQRLSIANSAQMTADRVVFPGSLPLGRMESFPVNLNPNRQRLLDWCSVASSGDEGKSEFPVSTCDCLLRVPGDFRQVHPPLLFSLAKDFFIPGYVANSVPPSGWKNTPGQSLSAISPVPLLVRMLGWAVGSPDPLSGKSRDWHHRVRAVEFSLTRSLGNQVSKGGMATPCHEPWLSRHAR
ncbi:hypothetical protein ASPBRDRAFT_133898 [Aspergillus brasiliensis CBS 101740]|uniref:Uncharacterized protein n=1 Tax=Aspergillus brasiliensis (strain CBS 101740 / IMI 381727 / IBT 21946) TaxID=767769 RepID=A0A1L9U8P3_ASPBC|nr:hypothetical protein ASPBRDRAFT_133898 [Aspergillus brasiliensis CBS 101740]